MAWSATLFNTNALYQGVNQLAHGFIVGDIVRYDGVAFVLAQADNEPNAEIVGMVSNVQDANSFYLTQVGYIFNIASAPVNPGGAYIPGSLYYLSETNPGALTATKPTTVGQVELPCFIAYTATTGFFFANVGTLIDSGSVFQWNAINSDQTLLVNNGYIVEAAAPLSLDLPSTAAIGDTIKVASTATSIDSVLITQAANQYILLAEDSTTVGITGGLELIATNGIIRGSCELVCIEQNLGWRFMNGTGTWDLI